MKFLFDTFDTFLHSFQTFSEVSTKFSLTTADTSSHCSERGIDASDSNGSSFTRMFLAQDDVIRDGLSRGNFTPKLFFNNCDSKEISVKFRQSLNCPGRELKMWNVEVSVLRNAKNVRHCDSRECIAFLSHHS